MSAGGLLEIPAFILGLTAVADAYDRVCLIWKTIAKARDFGDSVAAAMSKLEMEFFRFQVWYTALENLAHNQGVNSSPPAANPEAANSSLVVHFKENLESPVVLAASNIQQLLEDAQKVLAKNGVLAVARTIASALVTAGNTNPGNLELKSTKYRETQKQFAEDLQRKTPWRKRLKHDATPWRDKSDEVKLDSISKDMSYWNDSLYGLLPTKIRDSILEQGLAGTLLANPAEAEAVSFNAAGKMPALSETAKLLLIRQQTSRPTRSHDELELEELIQGRECSGNFDNLPEVFDGLNPFSVLGFKDDMVERRAIIEWYPYPQNLEGVASAWTLARDRIARLSYLLAEGHKPTTLHTLNSIGFVDNSRAACFGLVSSIPTSVSPAKGIISLFHLLSRSVVSPASPTIPAYALLPSLAERFNLAALMASSLYTFRLARWYHKRFNSIHVGFMYDEFPNIIPKLPDLTKPYVGGFVVSRPDDPTGVSLHPGKDLQTTPTIKELEIYFHPSYRVALPSQGPLAHFRAAFDFYSFGVMLAEIGFWNTMHKIVPQHNRMAPEDLRKAIISKCSNDLACWMGDRYREVTLRCLRAEDVDAGGIGEDLNDFYWEVVLELIKCLP